MESNLNTFFFQFEKYELCKCQEKNWNELCEQFITGIITANSLLVIYFIKAIINIRKHNFALIVPAEGEVLRNRFLQVDKLLVTFFLNKENQLVLDT